LACRALSGVVGVLGAIGRRVLAESMALSSYRALSSVVGESAAIGRKKALSICNTTLEKAPNVRILLELVAWRFPRIGRFLAYLAVSGAIGRSWRIGRYRPEGSSLKYGAFVVSGAI
jgi:hypothetical protein